MKRLSFVAALFATCVLGGASAFAGDVVPLATTRVASGLNRPIFMTFPPGVSDRLFIMEQRGVIKILNIDSGDINPTPFLDIDSIVANIFGNSEQGLLGLAFHPDYQSNGLFYVNYTDNSGDTVIARYSVSADPDVADESSAVEILTFDQPFSNHNGGWIGFGPDGFLYIATGDGGSGNDPQNNAQDITNEPLGKMLRIDVEGHSAPGGNYSIPEDNPFVGQTGDDEIWAYGLRNPFRNSFDRLTGDLWIADVGQNAIEEVDFQPASSDGGENYGWRCMEGNNCTGLSGCTCNSPSLTDPIQTYTHNFATGGFSITGGYVYRGCAIPSFDGFYIYGDFVTANIWRLQYDGSSVNNFEKIDNELSPSIEGVSVNDIASFAEDSLGELYIVDRGGTTTGQIFKIIPDPDEVEIEDCNENGQADSCDIASGDSSDDDGNGIPDECEDGGDPDPDLNGDGSVNGADLGILLGNWNTDGLGDLNEDDNIDGSDLGILLGAWTG